MKRLLVIVICISLSACATMQRHPVVTTVVTSIVIGSIAASHKDHHNDQDPTRWTIPPTPSPETSK